MSVADSLRDRRALLLRLIMAEALAKRGQGPLALRSFPVRREPDRAPAAEPKPPEAGEP